MEDHNRPAADPSHDADEQATLVELLDRLLNQGVVLCGDLAISVADIELVYARLQLTLSSVETARQAGWHTPMQCAGAAPPAPPRP